ncbi:MAG: BrnT family toxin [Syntrophobacteraceae bacterium]
MEIEFDPEKNARNIELRGVSFEDAVRFEWESAVIIPDTRLDYGEPRYRAFGIIDNRLHALVFTPRGGVIRVVSLRKANRREVHRYETQNQS